MNKNKIDMTISSISTAGIIESRLFQDIVFYYYFYFIYN